MSPLAAYFTFILLVIVSLSAALNVYYFVNLSSINDEITLATGATGKDEFGLQVKKTQSLARSLIQDNQQLECKLAPYQKAMGTGGDLLGLVTNLNPITIVTRAPSIFSNIRGVIDLTRRSINDCQ